MCKLGVMDREGKGEGMVRRRWILSLKGGGGYYDGGLCYENGGGTCFVNRLVGMRM